MYPHAYSHNYQGTNQQNALPVLPNQSINYPSAMFYGKPNQQALRYQQPQFVNFAGNVNVGPATVPIPQAYAPINPNDPEEKQKRYKLEQQRKFRNFGKISKNATMDSMLSNMVSSTEKSLSTPKKVKGRDDFGEFLQAALPSSTSLTSTTSEQITKSDKVLPNGQDNISVKSVPTSTIAETSKSSNHSISLSGVDLQSKMMASLDFTQSNHAYMKFQPITNQAPKRPEKKTYLVSTKAADWSSLSVAESEFQEEPTSPAVPSLSPSISPVSLNNVWLTDVERAPLVYQHVYEASLAADGYLDTSRLYPILLQCNLPNEILGKLWSLANQSVPGRLNQQELFILLALIALTQGGNNSATVDHVMRLSAPPIPFLTAYANQQKGSEYNKEVQLSKSSINQQALTNEVGRNDDFDDFQDFQSTSNVGLSSSNSAFQPVGTYLSNFKTNVFQTSMSPSPLTDQAQPGSFSSNVSIGGNDVVSVDSKNFTTQATISDNLAVQDSLHTKPPSPLRFQANANLSDFYLGDSVLSTAPKSDLMTHSILPDNVPTSGNDTSGDNSGISIVRSLTDSGTHQETQKDKDDSFFVPVFESLSSTVSKTASKISPPPVTNESQSSPSPRLVQSRTMEHKSDDRYAAFAALSVKEDDEFQMFQDGSADKSNLNDFPAQPPSYSSIFALDEHIMNKPNPDQTSASEPFSVPLTSITTSSSVVSSIDVSRSVPTITKSNSAKFDLFKSAIAKSRSIADASPVQSDTVSVQSLELSLSHSILHQSLGTTADPPKLGNRTPSPALPNSPQPKPRKYGPSFCDDDYDMNDMIPPPDLPPDSYDEFDVFQEGNSSLVDFDAFSSYEPQPKQRTVRLTSPAVVTEQEENPDDFTSSSDMCTVPDSSKTLSLNITEHAKSSITQRVGTPTPPPSPLRHAFKSMEEIDVQSRPNSIKSEPCERSRQQSIAETIGIGTDWSLSATSVCDIDNYIDKWEKCLVACLDIICQTNQILSSIHSPSVCSEVVYSIKGQRFVSDLSEVYGIAKRIRSSMTKLKIERDVLQNLLKQIELAWNNLLGFCSNVPIIDHSAVSSEEERMCGVCLMSLDSDTIEYAAKRYHSTCANFWVNQVDHVLPALEITEHSSSLI